MRWQKRKVFIVHGQSSSVPNEEESQAMRKRLDALIYVSMNLKRFETMTAEKKILELKSLGFGDTEIAGIIGKTRGYVASVTSRARKG